MDEILSFLARFERGELNDAFDVFLQTGLDTPAVDDLSMTVSKSALLLLGFDWMAWRRELHEDPFAPSQIAAADLEGVRRALTYAIREDRFNGGSLAKRCADGLIERALRRLAAIRAAECRE